MKRQQEHFKKLQDNENQSIRDMESDEQKLLEAYQQRKKLEASRKQNRQVAHQKLCCR